MGPHQFFPLMLVLVALNAAVVIYDNNYWALWGWGVVLCCLGGWRNDLQQLAQANASFQYITKQLQAARQELTRG